MRLTIPIMLAALATVALAQTADDPVAKALDEARYEDAISILSKTIAANPKDISAHFNLALAYTLQNKDDQASL